MNEPATVKLPGVRDDPALEAESAALERAMRGGWWRRGAVVVSLTAIVAVTVPITSGVRAYFETERDVALQAAEQAHARAMERERQLDGLRAAYLDPAKAPAEQLKALRLLLAMDPQAELKAWAEGELARATAPVSPPPVAMEPEPSRRVTPPAPVPPAMTRPAKARPPPPPQPAGAMALKDDPY